MRMRPQDLVLTMFGNHVREPGDTAWSGGLVALLGDLGFSAEAARAALNRVVGRDLIARIRRGREVHYALTPAGRSFLAEGDRRIFSFARGDLSAARWTVLWHNTPEPLRVERARLAARLRFLGFGPVQDATWVAPHDREEEVRALLESIGVAEHAAVVVGRLGDGSDLRRIVAQAWDLEEVQRRYQEFLEGYARYGSARSRRALDDRAAFLVRTRATNQFRQFPALDPELPDELMPRPRLRPKAIALFDRLHADLQPGADRHFALAAGTRP